MRAGSDNCADFFSFRLQPDSDQTLPPAAALGPQNLWAKFLGRAAFKTAGSWVFLSVSLTQNIWVDEGRRADGIWGPNNQKRNADS